MEPTELFTEYAESDQITISRPSLSRMRPNWQRSPFRLMPSERLLASPVSNSTKTSAGSGQSMLASRLRAARQDKCLTLAKLGAALDPARGRGIVCEWEKGRCEPSLSTIAQIAAALGVTPCWLAFGCKETHGK